MKRTYRLLTLAAFFVCIHQFAFGAEVQKLSEKNAEFDVITITGPIAFGDERRFSDIAATSSKAVVLLSSEGGNVSAALEIGRGIRLKGFATAAPGLCASACAFIWLAGSPRMLDTKSHIGFHAVYIKQADKLLIASDGNALVGAYLSQLGYSTPAIIFITSAPPEGMKWLTPSGARSVGIDFISLEESSPSSPPPPRHEIANERYDPMSIVTGFYSALRVADGSAAAALVIPEKRGVGPFNEVNISSFFGNMRVPLQLQSTRLLSNGLVLAEYSYVHASGKVCNGKSEVATVYMFGKTLIRGIRALNKC